MNNLTKEIKTQEVQTESNRKVLRKYQLKEDWMSKGNITKWKITSIPVKNLSIVKNLNNFLQSAALIEFISVKITYSRAASNPIVRQLKRRQISTMQTNMNLIAKIKISTFKRTAHHKNIESQMKNAELTYLRTLTRFHPFICLNCPRTIWSFSIIMSICRPSLYKKISWINITRRNCKNSRINHNNY